MKNNQEFNPINLKSLRQQVEKKKTDREKKRSNQELKSALVQSEGLCGTTLYSFSGYGGPFFLDNLKKVELNFLDDADFDKETIASEGWKKTEVVESLERALEKAILDQDRKPFEIGFSYRTREALIKLGVLSDSYKDYSIHRFYLPDDYKADVKRFNEYAVTKSQKNAHEKLADMIHNISPN